LLLALIQPESANLTSDRRLAARVEIRSDAETTPEVCARLSKETGVSLTAHPSLSNDLVVLYAPNRPAAEVMKMLAEHFAWQWIKSGEGYVLRQTAPYEVQADAVIRDHALTKGRANVHEARDALKAWAQVNLRTEAQAVRRLEQARESKELSDEQEQALVKHANRLNSMGPFATRVSASVSDNEILDLSRRRLVYAANPTPYQRRLTPTMSAALQELLANMRLLQASMSASEKEQLRERGPTLLGVDTKEVASCRIVLSDPLTMELYLLDRDGFVLFGKSGYGGDTPSREWSDEASTRLVGDAVPDALTATVDGPGQVLMDESSEPLRPVARHLTSSAKAAGVCMVADCFDLDAEHADWGQASSSLAATCESWSGATGRHWSYRNGWVTLRADDWRYARSLQLPRALLRDWLKEERDAGGFTFTRTAELLTRISPEQSVSRVVADLFNTPRELHEVSMYLFWNSLPASRRQSLMAGGAVTLGTLPRASAQFIKEFLYSAGAMRPTGSRGGCILFPSPFDEPDFKWPDDEEWKRPEGRYFDREITQTLDQSDGWQLRLTSVKIPGLWGRIESHATVLQPSSLARWIAPNDLTAGLPTMTSCRLVTQDAYQFEIRDGQGQWHVFRASGAVKGAPTGLGLAHWPTDLQRRVQAHAGPRQKQAPPPPYSSTR
jgi:hypothetical protein